MARTRIPCWQASTGGPSCTAGNQLTSSAQRDDWAGIPDLLAAYQGVRGAANRGDLQGAQQALALFGRTAVFCPDLLAPDGQRLRDLVRQEVERAFPATATAGRPGSDMPELAELPLFAQ
ncbi:hypothetical protein ACFYWX_35940 [Streptomyces sp. NPDC002888]|uniref:hypothetical protein n=1 Tax=Streptomyces sp. NPDC002888 TaxID=3364668 RepID=UPI0036B324D5